MEKSFDRYFLAANSFEGFVSHFSDSYSAESGYKTYIIKGGPGTGKSSLMKYVAIRAIEKGYTVHLCHCSSDPDSLDGVIIDEKKIVILDGTAPHIVEPKYPGTCENIVDLGRFWDSENLRSKRIDIINATNINKSFHKTVSLYLSICGEIAKDSLSTAVLFTKKNKVVDFANKTAKKFIKERNGKTGTETVRFLQGITPKGIMSFPKTVTDNIKNVLVLEDKYGAFSGIVTEYIRKYALKNGYDIITIKNPFLPGRLIDHIIIPSLDFAVVTENDFIKFETTSKRIHSRRFTDFSVKHTKKAKLAFNEKIKNKFLFSAIESLKKAKNSHDVLEKYYIESMDFESLEKYTKEFCEEILK